MDLGVLGQYGAIGLLAAIFIGLYIRSMNKGDAREERIAAEALAREIAMREECKEREEKLAARLTQVENERNKANETLIVSCAETNKVNAETNKVFARALERWTDAADIGSGKHSAR